MNPEPRFNKTMKKLKPTVHQTIDYQEPKKNPKLVDKNSSPMSFLLSFFDQEEALESAKNKMGEERGENERLKMMLERNKKDSSNFTFSKLFISNLQIRQ
jgi:hypothetical protein